MIRFLKEMAGLTAAVGATLTWRVVLAVGVIMVIGYLFLGDDDRCRRLEAIIRAWRGK
jgi:hypothetical protein